MRLNSEHQKFGRSCSWHQPCQHQKMFMHVTCVKPLQAFMRCHADKENTNVWKETYLPDLDPPRWHMIFQTHAALKNKNSMHRGHDKTGANFPLQELIIYRAVLVTYWHRRFTSLLQTMGGEMTKSLLTIPIQFTAITNELATDWHTRCCTKTPVLTCFIPPRSFPSCIVQNLIVLKKLWDEAHCLNTFNRCLWDVLWKVLLWWRQQSFEHKHTVGLCLGAFCSVMYDTLD